MESLWTHISEHIKLLVDEFAPKWKPRRLSKGHPWFDTELRKALRQRNRAWKNFKSTGSGYEHYQSIRNKCSSMKLSKRETYEENLAIASSSSPKRLFAYLNRRTRSDCRVSLTNPNGERMTAQDMAEIFAVQYAETYAPDLEPIPVIDDKASNPWLDDDISPNEVKEFLHILNFNKSPGPDGIHPLVLKELADVIAMPLTVLFNMSIQCGKLPSEWKTAVIKPMYKSGSRSLPVNYRPVSLTCIACKILERVIVKRMQKHLESNSLLQSGQHGFRPKRSCTTNLLVARESWAEARSNGKDVDVIYIDLSKAFDKVPHQRLLQKLAAYGIAGNTLRWTADFLTGRTFKVGVDSVTPEPKLVNSGVPQGSVLGPTLYLIYVIDLLANMERLCFLEGR